MDKIEKNMQRKELQDCIKWSTLHCLIFSAALHTCGLLLHMCDVPWSVYCADMRNNTVSRFGSKEAESCGAKELRIRIWWRGQRCGLLANNFFEDLFFFFIFLISTWPLCRVTQSCWSSDSAKYWETCTLITQINASEYRLLSDKHLFNTHHLSHVVFSWLEFWQFNSFVNIHKKIWVDVTSAIYAFRTFHVVHVIRFTYSVCQSVVTIKIPLTLKMLGPFCRLPAASPGGG